MNSDAYRLLYAIARKTQEGKQMDARRMGNVAVLAGVFPWQKAAAQCVRAGMLKWTQRTIEDTEIRKTWAHGYTVTVRGRCELKRQIALGWEPPNVAEGSRAVVK